MAAGASKESKFPRSVRERLNRLSCPYTQNVDQSWILDLIFTPGEPRIRLLQWLFIKFNSKLVDVLELRHPLNDTKMDSRVQRLLYVASRLGLCSSEDADLIRGVKSGLKQKAFIDKLLDMACYADCTESSTVEKFVKSQRLVHKLSQSNIDSMFPSSITLLPPDIARQIDLESQAPAVDRQTLAADLEKLEEQIAKLDRDLEKQNEVLSELCRKHGVTDADAATTKSTLRQTTRLALSGFDQLLTSFTYCYDSELRPWCGSTSTPTAQSTLGPALKHVHAPLEQLTNLVTSIQSIKVSIVHLCSELRRDVIRLRQQATDLAVLGSSQDATTLSRSLQETVDVLEQSLTRVEEQSVRSAARPNSSVTSSAKIKLT